ncbi:hypothetical protein INR99_07250 [Chitinilyticum litopenaei]|uniref:Uncharacterized protein n=1 Tax=Chitinilyticum piscinae TaxID=2866724 RepID=A0A8J7FZE6_9NEIS|nr:hypothetical protein [Chitinilyticum piscinae]
MAAAQRGVLAAMLAKALQRVISNTQLGQFGGQCQQLAIGLLLRRMVVRHLRQMRALYSSRRDLLLEELLRRLAGAITPQHSGAGLQFAVTVPAGHEVPWTLAGQAAGLVLRSLSRQFLGPVTQEGWLLGYTALQNQEIRSAVAALERSIDPPG